MVVVGLLLRSKEEERRRSNRSTSSFDCLFSSPAPSAFF
jgi:hypothetical protein